MRQRPRTATVRRGKNLWLAIFFLLCLCMTGSLLSLRAIAQEATAPHYGGDFWTRPKLTGDWGGTRDEWAAKGFTIDLDTAYTFQGVPSGGIDSQGHSTGNTLSGDLVFGLDTTRAGLWPGGSFKLRLEGRWGESVLDRAGTVSPVNVDALFPASADHADETVFGLTELTYRQFFTPHVGIVGGLLNTLDADSNAIAGSVRGNETFLNSAFLASPVEVAGAPSVALGGGLIFIPSPSILGTLTAMGSQETATDNPFDNWNGTTIATEWTFKHQLGGLPGGQVVGALYAIGKERTDIFADPRLFLRNLVVDRSALTTEEDSWAIYYNAHQYIQGDQEHGWGPFFRAGLSDGDPNPIKWNMAVGIGGKGLFPGRDRDGWGVGYYHLDIRDAGLLSAVNIGNEDGGEVFYSFSIAPSVRATLDAQYVSSARAAQDPAWVLGARLTVGF